MIKLAEVASFLYIVSLFVCIEFSTSHESSAEWTLIKMLNGVYISSCTASSRYHMISPFLVAQV